MRVTPTLQIDKSTQEIGDLAVWRVSSAKSGNGVNLLRDDREDTYWQSDGAQPHVVTLEFQRKVTISAIALQTDCKLDESYTPAKICVRAGTDCGDMKDIKSVELKDPVGWVVISLLDDAAQEANINAWMLEVVVLSNHQNGRDTHIRQLKVFGPRINPMEEMNHGIGFTSTDFTMRSVIR